MQSCSSPIPRYVLCKVSTEYTGYSSRSLHSGWLEFQHISVLCKLQNLHLAHNPSVAIIPEFSLGMHSLEFKGNLYLYLYTCAIVGIVP